MKDIERLIALALNKVNEELRTGDDDGYRVWMQCRDAVVELFNYNTIDEAIFLRLCNEGIE